MKYLNKDVRSIFVFVCFVFSSFVIAEENRDYYAEPGLNPFQETVNQHFNEHIDPFGGTLQLKYTDMVIPGNGGMDIRINRSYISLQEKLGLRKTTGVGWTMHFGRVMVDAPTGTEAVARICQSGPSADPFTSTDNPSIEFADGGRELLVLEPSGQNNYLITKSRWKMACEIGLDGVRVTSPDGTQYTMTKWMHEADSALSTTYSYLTTEIKDLQGNWINIEYGDNYGFTYITQITTSDNRVVDYTYYPITTDNHVLLESISSNNQTITYNYEKVIGSAVPYYHLKEVVRPDGTKWVYNYYPQLTQLGEAGSHSLKTVTYPYGGTISYEYTPVYFDPANTNFPTTSIKTKTIGGRDITPAIWTYQYDPASTIGYDYDYTTVNAPNGKTIYQYFGYSSNYVTAENTWIIGMLRLKETYDTSNNLIETEQTAYEPELISNEDYIQSRLKRASATYVSRIKQKFITRDGTNYVTDFSNYDTYGNARHIVESGNVDTRTTDYTFYIDTTKWILNQLEDETTVGVGTIDRTFNTDVTLKSESKYGVLTEYTYHSEGDLATVTDARGKALGYNTKFNDYYRGVAREEIHPVSSTKNITTRKTVNPTGTVKSKTNGRQFTTSYTYDDLNRLKTITYPKADSAGVSIDYTSTGKILTRGDFQQIATVDGFGQTINSTNKDTLKNITISTNQTYDALGQKTFQSYPNDTLGTSFEYDALGRQIRVNHSDSTFSKTEFLANNQTRVTNERNNPTTYSFRSYGNPSEQSLIRIDSLENISTTIDRNKLGQQTRVWQGTNGGTGLEKIYGYDSRYFLKTLTQPEIEVTTFGRDEIGNLTGKQIGTTVLSNFEYDFQNRLTLRNYNDPELLNVAITYDDNSNIKTLKRGNEPKALFKMLTYDENNNLTREDVNYYSFNAFSIIYSPNNLDHINSITYPSGRIITYAPDALGRPTKASPLLTSINYYPSGQTKQINYANGQVTDMTLNNRLWVENMTTSGISQAVDLTYGYDGAGNIENISNANDPSYDRSFVYDGVDRLKDANGIWGLGTLSYDELGNIETKTIGSHTLTYNYLSNRLDTVTGSDTYTMSYDVQGNIYNTGKYLSYYNNAGNLSQTVVAGATTDYRYDGNDRRSIKIEDKWEMYLYSQSDNLLAEFNEKGGWDKEHIYLGTQLISTVERVNDKPISVPGTYAPVDEGTAIQLNGNGSYDLDGTVESYEWRQISGPTVVLLSSYTATPTFTAPYVQANSTLTFELAVTDNEGAVGTQTVDITVQDLVQIPPIITGLYGSSGDGQTSLYWKGIDAASFNIYWSTTPGITKTNSNEINVAGSAYIHTGLTNNVKYYYAVSAVNSHGESALSQEITVTTGSSSWSDFIEESFPVNTYLHLVKSTSSPSGNKMSVFEYDNQVYWKKYVPGQNWSESRAIPYTKSFKPEKVAVSNDGKYAVAVMRDMSGETWNREMYIASIYNLTTDSWTNPIQISETITNDKTYVTNLSLKINSSGAVAASWKSLTYGFYVSDKTYYIHAASYNPLSGTWQRKKILNNFGYTNRDKTTNVHLLENNNFVVEMIDYFTDEKHISTIDYNMTANAWGTFINHGKVVEGNHDGHSILYSENNELHLLLSMSAGANLKYKKHSPITGWSFYDFDITGLAVDMPKLASGGNNELMAVWRSKNLAGDMNYNSSYFGSNNIWSPIEVITNTPVSITDNDLVLFGSNNGRFTVVWDEGGLIKTRSYILADGWSTEYAIGNNSNNNVKYSSNSGGDILLVWENSGFINSVIYINNVGWSGVKRYQEITSNYSILDVNMSETKNGSVQVYDNTFGIRSFYTNGASAGSNYAPIANAGNDKSVGELSTINLNGTLSSDIDGQITSYKWEQMSGPVIIIDNPTSEITTFITPEVSSETDLTFKLTVTDDKNAESSDTVLVKVFPSAKNIVIVPGYNENKLYWEPTGESGNIYWSTSPDVTVATGNKIANVSSPYLHRNLTTGQSYYYIITRNLSAGFESYPSQIKSATPSVDKPGPRASFSLSVPNSVDNVGMAGLANNSSVISWVDADTNKVMAGIYSKATGLGNIVELGNTLTGVITPVTVSSNNNNAAIVSWHVDKELWSSIYVVGTGWTTPSLIAETTYRFLKINSVINTNSDAIVSFYSQEHNRKGQVSSLVRTINYSNASGWDNRSATHLSGDGALLNLNILMNANKAYLYYTDSRLGNRCNIILKPYVNGRWQKTQEIISKIDSELTACNTGAKLNTFKMSLNEADDMVVIYYADYSEFNNAKLSYATYDLNSGWNNAVRIVNYRAVNYDVHLNELGDAVFAWYQYLDSGVVKDYIKSIKVSKATGWQSAISSFDAGVTESGFNCKGDASSSSSEFYLTGSNDGVRAIVRCYSSVNLNQYVTSKYSHSTNSWSLGQVMINDLGPYVTFIGMSHGVTENGHIFYTNDRSYYRIMHY